MGLLDKQVYIRQKAVENRADPDGTKIFWSRHTIVEMVNDGLTRADVEEALIRCEVIEDYPSEHRSLPDCLVLAKLTSSKPLHTVVAIDEVNDRIFMVTGYLPSPERWENDWRTRK